jgi:hypothetical protein
MIGFSIEKALVIFKDKDLQFANKICNAVNEEIKEILISFKQLQRIRNRSKASLKSILQLYQFNSLPPYNSPPAHRCKSNSYRHKYYLLC